MRRRIDAGFTARRFPLFIPAMRSGGWFSLAVSLGALLGGALKAAPLPRVALEPVWPKLILQRPLWLEELPDESGRFLIVEQDGRVWLVQEGEDGRGAELFMDISDRRPFEKNEEGLLGLACHPQWEENGLFYVYYTQQNPKRSVISEIRTTRQGPLRADMATERVILEIPQPYWNHNGGQLSFGPDGYLYISTGDGGAANDPHNNAQNTASLLGKILRIDVNGRSGKLQYAIPPDNPFVHEGYGVRKEIWAYGLRNVWRMSWDRETGELWAGDVGQNKWEYVHIIRKGGNHGWCVREGFHHFKPGPEGARYVEPIIEYPHTPQLAGECEFPGHPPGTSITGGYVYRGTEQRALRGIYLYADFTLGTIFGLRRQNGRVVQYGALLEQPKNVASFGQDSFGELYVLVFDGPVMRVVQAD